MNSKNFTSLEMSKELARLNLFQDEPESYWSIVKEEDFKGEWTLVNPIDATEEYENIIAVPLWRLMEELPSFWDVNIGIDGTWYINEGAQGKVVATDNHLPDALAKAFIKLKEMWR